jgi:hypothetical protein
MMTRSVILLLAADPARTDVLALEQERAILERELRLTPGSEDFELRSRWAATPGDLARHLLELQPTIIHFWGHGSAGIILEGGEPGSRPVAPAELTEIIGAAAGTARLALLTACYSQPQAAALRDAVGCVIGMRGTIDEDAARAFAIGFYRALGHRRSVGNAYEQARGMLAGRKLEPDAEPRYLVRAGIDLDAMLLGGAASPSPGAPAARYELFLSCAPPDKPSAHALCDLLQPEIRAFLDERSLLPGDPWHQQVPAAQRASRATVILISRRTDPAWFLGRELVTALALHRAAPTGHSLIPVLLDPEATIPFGLRHVQAIEALAEGTFEGVAARLRDIAMRLRGQAAPLPSSQAVLVGGSCDHVALHDRLSRLTDTLFEQILAHARLGRSLVASRSTPLADRALAVAQLAALDQELCRRITALLDQRAP